jgi:hypothetical protein
VAVTTHRQAWLQRAGVVVALTTSALLALPATFATAAPPIIKNVSAAPNSVDPGGTTTVTYTLDVPTGETADVDVTSNNGKLTCASGCSPRRVGSGNQSATFRYSTTATANETAVITIRVTTSGALGGSNQDQASTQVTLVGKPAPQQPQTVKEVSGRVTDFGTGLPVPNATVGIRDSAGHSYSATTSDSGSYRFLGSSGQPIVPGQIEIGAAKGNINSARTVSAAAGQALTNQKITLKLTAATPTATPSATESAIDQPTDTPGDASTTPAGGQPGAGSQKSSGTSMGSLLLIIVGGLLVALGVGAIVLLWMRRKDNGDDESDGPGAGGGGPRGAVPPGQGGYGGDQTRVANRAGMGADPTMVGGAALADAPTMMHNRPLVDDEFPDPYGAPLPTQHPGYGAADQDWAGDGYGAGGAPTQAGYGAGAAAGGYGGNAPGSGAGYGNAPGSGAGYGNAPSSGGGYNNAPGSGAGYPGRDYGAAGEPAGYPSRATGGYGEPTGRYQGGGGDDYGQPADPYETGTYNAAGGGHGAGQQQYGQDAGHGQRAGYGDQNPNGGGYDADGGYGSDSSGYGQQQGYGAQPGGYDQRGGYDQQGGYDQGQHGGGYDQRGADQGYYGNRDAGGRARQDEPEQANRSGRRSLDWLDD